MEFGNFYYIFYTSFLSTYQNSQTETCWKAYCTKFVVLIQTNLMQNELLSVAFIVDPLIESLPKCASNCAKKKYFTLYICVNMCAYLNVGHV